MSSRPMLRRIVLAASAACALFLSGCGILGRGGEIEGWRVRFRGARELDEDALRDAVRDDLERVEEHARRPGGANTPALDGAEAARERSRDAELAEQISLEDAVWSLERLYRSRGFVSANVRGTLVPISDDAEGSSDGAKRALRFTIREGPRIEVESLTIRGNQALKASELAALFDRREAGLFESRKRWYVESEVRDLARSIRELYIALGYLDVAIDPPRTTLDEGAAKARIELEIHEGRRYVLGEVRFEGELLGLERALEALGRERKGKPYDPNLPRTLRGRAEDLFGRRGHADARVRLSRENRVDADDRDTGSGGAVELTFQVEPGPVVSIGEIHVEGNEHTDLDLVRDALELHTGSRYDAAKVRDAAQRLQATGLFSSVRVELEDAPPDDEPRASDERGVTRPLRVALEELPRRELFIEPSYGSYERIRLKAGWRERNLFGTGRELATDGTLGELAQDARIALVDPRLFGSDARGETSIFGNRRKEPGFTRAELGASFTATKRFSRELQGSVTYSLRRSRSSDVDTTDPDVLAEIGSVDISSVKLALLYDARDDPFAPESGFVGRAAFEYASPVIGSGLGFLRGTSTVSNFTRLWRGAVLGASWRAGVIAPHAGTDEIPLQERFFNGGENRVRSFHENELGPRGVDGELVGGEAFNVFSIELRQQLLGRLDGALFHDLGNVERDHEDFLEFSGFERAVGVGLRYMLPIGPIRLDAGFNPWHDDGEESYVIHLSVGMAF